MPKRFLNKLLFIVGATGLLFQLIARIYALVQGINLEWHWWFNWLAPVLCLMWALIPFLQLQKEPEKKP